MNLTLSKRESSLKSKLALGGAAAILTFAVAPSIASTHTTVKALSGAEQQTTYASAFPAPLVVWVSDPSGERAVSGARVHFTSEACIGLSSTVAVTDESGLAMVSAIGLKPCEGKATAFVEGAPKATVSFDGLVVNKAVLTIVPADLDSKPGTVPAITDYFIVGFVNGETEDSAHITGAPVLSTTASASSIYGNYAIKGNVGTLTAENYTFEPGFGTLAITADPSTQRARDRRQEAGVAIPSAKTDSIEVRPALQKESVSLLPIPTVFVGSARKDSDVPVHSTILRSIPTATEFAPHSPIAPVDMPGFAAPERTESAAPVRAAIARTVAAKQDGQTSSAAIAPVEMPGFETSAPAEFGIRVHPAIGLNPQANLPAFSPSQSAVSIHKALVPPGTK
jgi:hypothetical protein